MRINENFVFQEIAGDYIVVPVGEATRKISGILKLNSTSAFLWKELSNHEQSRSDLVIALVNEFSIDTKRAVQDVDVFIEKLKKIGCLEMT